MKLFPCTLSLALAAALSFAGPVFAQDEPSGSGAPSEIPVLGGFAYGSGSGEVFWRRPNTATSLPLRYRVTRDGREVAFSDARSHVDRTLSPGTTYTWCVTAVDAEGRESPESCTVLTTSRTRAAPRGELPFALTGLNLTARSSGLIELDWNDAPAPNVRYEVSRSGPSVDDLLVKVAGTPGSRVRDERVVPGARYVYSVRLITYDVANGRFPSRIKRSPPSVLSVRVPSGTGPGFSPDRPADLRAEVYSATSAELFWQRASTSGLRYEVRRDGVVLGTTNGTSRFDDSLVGGRDYRYEVIAIDGGGARSSAASLTVRTDRRGPVTAPGDGKLSYELPRGADVLQAKLAGPLPSYAVVCNYLLDLSSNPPCRVAPGTYQLQTFDTSWRGTAREVTISAEGDPTPTPPTAPPPTAPALAAPTNVVFTAYSSRSGAVSWARPATPELRYEVRRDDRLVTTTDGTSYVDRSLVAGRNHVYEIVAIAPDGRRSPTSRTTIDGAGAPTPPSAATLAAPTGLAFTVYSSTAGALSWTRPSTPGLRYEVRRDGMVVAETDGISYQARSLSPGIDYTYEVVALDGDARRSEPARLVARTGEGSDPNPNPNPNPEPEPEPEPVAGSGTVPAATLPSVGDDGRVVWPFAPVAGGLTIDVSVYTRLPRARSGRQPRINDMAHANGRLYALVEEDGRIYDITDGDAPTLWLDVAVAIPAATGRALDTNNRFHGGLRSMAFHPDFLTNGRLYTSVMEERPTNRSGHVYLSDVADGIDADSVLVEWTVDPRSMVVDPGSYREVFRVGVPEYDHPIKQVEFDPSARRGDADYGLLHIGHGDGSVASLTARGGRRNDALGKVLRIDPLAAGNRPYRVPSDNPFIGDASMIDEVWSIGHRNPHHLSFAADGTLLVADVGRDNVDEINVVERGRDYGWAEREGAYVQRPAGTILDGIGRLPANDAANGFTYPVAAYGHEGEPGESFVTRAIVGGPVMRSASGGEPFYLYTEFARTGELLYSRMSDIRAAVTRGAPDTLTHARTRRASVRLDTDGDPSTPAVPQASLRAIVGFDPAYDGSGRVDDRFGTDAAGNLYIMNKRNGLIYRARIGGRP